MKKCWSCVTVTVIASRCESPSKHPGRSSFHGDVLDAIADHGVAVELSTAGLRKPIREIYPAITILQRMKQRDIHIVLSSDAHDPSEIAWEYESALQILDSFGYKNLITFDRRESREAPLG